MKQHWDFLKEHDTSFGLFYPHHYIVAAFRDDSRAESACQRFLSEGFAEDNVSAASGTFVTEKLESEEGAAWFDRLRATVARVIGTEADFLDEDLQIAREGGAFLFVYVPDEEVKCQARDLIEALEPIMARRYHSAGIEHIIHPGESCL